MDTEHIPALFFEMEDDIFDFNMNKSLKVKIVNVSKKVLADSIINLSNDL